MRIGIIFGGQSREREISFAGGRTVYDNLNKALFEPIPIFVDSLGNFVLLKWEFLYKGTIRDFYPISKAENGPFQTYVESIGDDELVEASISNVGRRITFEELPKLIDFAFLTLHGPYGEDGNIQGMLDWLKIPYSGSGILPSSIGIDKMAQKGFMKDAKYALPESISIQREKWAQEPEAVIHSILEKFGFPVVIKAPHQGSSIGVQIVKEKQSLNDAIDRCFFRRVIHRNEWMALTKSEKNQFISNFTDIRYGLGFPVVVNAKAVISHPNELLAELDKNQEDQLLLEALDGEATVIVESFIEGKEFSCIVIQDKDGRPMGLPPTEIRKQSTIFDYRSKYLPGISRKVTPIDLPIESIDRIRKKAEQLFESLNCQVYARIDGFFTTDEIIYLNDPNTTSGMLPSSFFFHQAAEIALDPSQFLTYIIHSSLKARISTGKNLFPLQKQLTLLDQAMSDLTRSEGSKIRVGVIMGGFSSERHISVESGRNIYEKLSSSTKYLPIPIFLSGTEEHHELTVIPINIMLKDNADDIKEKAQRIDEIHPVIAKVRKEASDITNQFKTGPLAQIGTISYQELSELIDFAFIALHGRPGEDGAIQKELEEHNIPYNGSGIESSRLTINKYETNELLSGGGLLTAKHRMVEEADFQQDSMRLITHIEAEFDYPFIAKPGDDGCSSAVKKIKNRAEFTAFCQMMFRSTPEFLPGPCEVLGLRPNEEFPQKRWFLIEELISNNEAPIFMEITGGVITHWSENKGLVYEAFEPSEALATGEVLSLEEKFLAGEGQNITPARFGESDEEYNRVASSVKNTLAKAAEICKVEGYCRIDAFVRIWPHKVETIIIEINSLPGMTPATAIFHQSALAGLKPYNFIDQIIDFGFQRQKRLKTTTSI